MENRQIGFWSIHQRGGVTRKFKTIPLFCSAVADVPTLGAFSATKPQHTENPLGQRLCSSGFNCKETWFLCMPSVEPGEDTISPFKENRCSSSVQIFLKFPHTGVFVVSGAGMAVGGGHFWSGRAAGLCSQDRNQFFIYKRKGNTGAGAQFPPLSQSALAETT